MILLLYVYPFTHPLTQTHTRKHTPTHTHTDLVMHSLRLLPTGAPPRLPQNRIKRQQEERERKEREASEKQQVNHCLHHFNAFIVELFCAV